MAFHWQAARLPPLSARNPKRTTKYPFTISFVSALTGDHVADCEFEYEAMSFAVVRSFCGLIAMGAIQGFPDPPRCLRCRYRLLYDGKQLDDYDILDYIVAADNPTVSVLVTQEPFADPCECPQCTYASQGEEAQDR